MYQINRVTESDIAQFLSLVNGPEWKRDNGLADSDSLTSSFISRGEMREVLRAAVSAAEKRRTILTLRRPTRAVTPEDFEYLVRAIDGVARAKCLPQRNLESDDPSSRSLEAPGHVSVVVLPLDGTHPSPDLLARVRQALEPARLLTTRVHVVAPRYVTVGVRLTVVPNRDVRVDNALRNTVFEKLMLFLDPHRGWFDGRGWPLGRDLYISELYQLIAETAGVDSVVPTIDSQGIPQDEIMLDAAFSGRIVRDESGRIQAISLRSDEFIDAQIEARNIKIARRA